MRFSKEFRQWYEKHFELSFPKQINMNYYCFNFKAMYDAFNAHNEELEQLREFRKKFQRLQNKLQQFDKKSYKDVQAEFKFNDVVEEIMYL